MNQEDNILNSLALNLIDGMTPLRQHALLEHFGSANELFDVPLSEIAKINGPVGENLGSQQKRDDAFRRAEKELQFALSHGIEILTLDNNKYSQRLSQCCDAPTVLYKLGYQDLNKKRFISIVGTRHATPYGKDVTRHIVGELAKHDRDIVIVSGLAYGVDIEAHRAAMDFGLNTIAVLAHGLDRIYPPLHRQDAVKITNGHGALVTEFPSLTDPVANNFLQRNRIIAGLSDVTIVVESAEKGGSMSTARLAVEYNRELFAVPGRLYDKNSAGCNRLIAGYKAEIFTSVDDLFTKMNWVDELEPELPFIKEESLQLTGIQAKIVNLIKENGALQINAIAQMMDESFAEISSTLGEMLFNDIVQQLPGDVYDLSFELKNK